MSVTIKIQKEIWKDVSDYNGSYKVSNFGNIKSLGSWSFSNLTQVLYFKKGKKLKPQINNHGYLVVKLSKKGKSKTFKLHKLIAQSFLNHIPCGMVKVVDHINSDKLDNKIENLQIITQLENVLKGKLCQLN